MQRIMKKSKIHTATITGLQLYYEGSVTIDQELLDQANILPGEQVQIVNLNNGERFESYTISGERNSGIIELNGPAARLAAIGDRIIIISYAMIEDQEAATFQSRVLFLDDQNRPIKQARAPILIRTTANFLHSTPEAQKKPPPQNLKNSVPTLFNKVTSVTTSKQIQKSSTASST